LRHGAYSDALLPWESEEEFAALHRSFVEDLKPKGACQEETIFAISHWTWKRRRVIRGSQISFYRSPAAKSLANGETTWDDMVRKNIQIPEDHEKWIAELHGFVKDLRLVSDHIKSHFYWTSSTSKNVHGCEHLI
jgi:hypothetical protein